jgi:uncharacterized protein (TIGR03067 family)
MRQYLRVGIGSVVFTLLFLGQSRAQKDEEDKFTGTWKVTYAAHGKKMADDDQLREMKVIIRGNKLTYIEDNPNPRKRVEETLHFTLKPNAKPKQIDFSKPDGGRWHGIYEIVSPSKIKLCWAKVDLPRPKTISAKEDHRVYTLELK